jgi:hypothetical protein
MRRDAEADRDDQFGERVASRLGPVPLTERVEREVLARIGQEPVVINHRSRPRRAAAALALAAGIAAVFAIGVLVGRRSGARPGLGSEVQSVEFVLRTVADSTVALVGDFNDWDPRATPLRPASDSIWSVVVPLQPGRYRYTFVVDGTRWSRDPFAPKALEDDFGRPTSVITVAQR